MYSSISMRERRTLGTFLSSEQGDGGGPEEGQGQEDIPIPSHEDILKCQVSASYPYRVRAC